MSEYTKVYSITEKHWDVNVYETELYDQVLRRINGKRTAIYSVGPAPDESLPLHIYFRGGWEELNLEITLRLSRFTGPVLLMGDFDTVPVFVSSEAKLTDLIDQWRKNREFRDNLSDR